MKKILMVLATLFAGCNGCSSIFDGDATIEEPEEQSTTEIVVSQEPECDFQAIPYPWSMEGSGVCNDCDCVRELQQEARDNKREKEACLVRLSDAQRGTGWCDSDSEFWAEAACKCVDRVLAREKQRLARSSKRH